MRRVAQGVARGGEVGEPRGSVELWGDDEVAAGRERLEKVKLRVVGGRYAEEIEGLYA